MTNPPQRTQHIELAIASPSEIEQTARQLAALRDGFLSAGEQIARTPRQLILSSWQRCQHLHVDPARRWAPLAIGTNTQLEDLREANAPLMRAARPVMDRLADFLSDSGYVIVLSDGSGCLLHVVGDSVICRRLARIDFVPGGAWGEETAGTNAIGTALADGHVVQLMAAEHYCDGWTDLTCTASPIRHPFTGAIIGVLDVTGNYRLIRSFLTGVLAAAALEITQGLRTLLPAPAASMPEYTLLYPVASRVSSPRHRISGTVPRREAPATYDDLTDSPSSPTVEDMRSLLSRQERRTRDAERLTASAGAINASLDLETALAKVAEQAAHLFALDCAAVCLRAAHDGSLSLRVWARHHTLHTGTRAAIETLLRRTDIASPVWERGEPIIIDDVRTAYLLADTALARAGIGSLALLPIVAARGVIGLIVAPRRVSFTWNVDDLRLGLALGAQAATVIENARLFNALQQHTHHIEALNAVAQLLNTLLDPGQRLDAVVSRILEILHLDAGAILLRDAAGLYLTLAAHDGLPELILRALREQAPGPFFEMAERVMASGEAQILIGREFDGTCAGEALRARHLWDVMVVPLAAGGVNLGVLAVWYPISRGLSGEELALFTTIGQQLGLALKNAQLLRAASEMEAVREVDRLKSEFLAAVSHDLRSPLTAIRASVESLLDRGREGQSVREQEHLLHNIAGQAGRLSKLVDQLLDLSRIEAGALALDRDWTELLPLIADVVSQFEALSDGRYIELDLPERLPLQYVDPVRLAQVLWNLLENACKYAPLDTPITVEARCDCEGHEIRIGVADCGPGIPASERGKIFQRFQRLDRDKRAHTSGSGLGLAICDGIVRAHGGRIWVEDRPGGGSAFRIALPLPPGSPVGNEGPEERIERPVQVAGKYDHDAWWAAHPAGG